MTRSGLLRFAIVALYFAAAPFASGLRAQGSDYTLKAERVAEDVYVFVGRTEHFTRANGGNIVNTGFIVAPAGVIVIDTGPSLRYGRAQREAIRTATGREVVQVLVTHAHPDHFLGSHAYVDVPVLALPETASAIASEGGKLAGNLYHLLGGWMEGTIAATPTTLADTGRIELAGRALRLIALNGHTGADLAVLDEASGVLFAGDLVFNGRAPTTPHADLLRWREALAELRQIPFRVLVPGHGPVSRNAAPIDQTDDYLRWLDDTLVRAADNGLDINEIMALPAPKRHAALPVFTDEFARTVIHLYPVIEARSLPRTQPGVPK